MYFFIENEIFILLKTLSKAAGSPGHCFATWSQYITAGSQMFASHLVLTNRFRLKGTYTQLNNKMCEENGLYF